MALFRRLYGERPYHLLAVAFGFAFAAFGVSQIFASASPWTVMAWLILAVVAHDFILLPLYSTVHRLAWASGRAERDARRRVPLLLHVTVPLALSGLLLLLWFPLILRLDPERYLVITGQSLDPYRWRWLALTAGLVAASAVLYVVRVLRAAGRAPTG